MLTKYEPWSVKNDKMDAWGIKITEGKFKDAVISFTSIDLKEDKDLEVDFHIVNSPSEDKDYTSEEFNQVLEAIINDIIRKAMDEFDQNRNSNSTKSST